MGFSIYRGGDWNASEFDTGSGRVAQSLMNLPRQILEGIQMKKENTRQDEKLKLEQEKEARAERQRLDEKEASLKHLELQDKQINQQGESIRQQGEQGNRRLDALEAELKDRGLMTTAQIKQMEYQNARMAADSKLISAKILQLGAKANGPEGELLSGELQNAGRQIAAFTWSRAEDMAVPGSAFATKISALKKQFPNPADFETMFKTEFQVNMDHNPEQVSANASTHEYNRLTGNFNVIDSALKTLSVGRPVASTFYVDNSKTLAEMGKEVIKQVQSGTYGKSEVAKEEPKTGFASIGEHLKGAGRSFLEGAHIIKEKPKSKANETGVKASTKPEPFKYDPNFRFYQPNNPSILTDPKSILDFIRKP